MATLTLDDQGTRDAAITDPTGFVAGLDGPVVIDEVQRAPDLLLAIKDLVDRDTTPGRFLLTGSSNILASKRIKDALTGRIETIRLWPLAQQETHGSRLNFVDALHAAEPPAVAGAPVGRQALREVLVAGGYPEARLRDGRRRTRWFDNLLDTALDRDLRDISDAVKTEAMPGFLRLLASQTANLLSYRAIGARVDLHHDTVKSYVGLLEQMYLIKRLPGWRPGLGAREVAKPKVYIADTGLAAHLTGADDERIRTDDRVTGKLVENFVATDIIKCVEWAARPVRLYHYRREREDRRQERFRAGIVIYTRAQSIPLGDRLWAVPLSGLWSSSRKT